jgi:hypothetical protein
MKTEHENSLALKPLVSTRNERLSLTLWRKGFVFWCFDRQPEKGQYEWIQ